MYLAGYGVGRFWIESLRTDQLLLPVLKVPVSMVLAAGMTIVSLTMIIIIQRKKHESEQGRTKEENRKAEGSVE